MRYVIGPSERTLVGIAILEQRFLHLTVDDHKTVKMRILTTRSVPAAGTLLTVRVQRQT